MFLLCDPVTQQPHIEARLTVDPDTALAALEAADASTSPSSAAGGTE